MCSVMLIKVKWPAGKLGRRGAAEFRSGRCAACMQELGNNNQQRLGLNATCRHLHPCHGAAGTTRVQKCVDISHTPLVTTAGKTLIKFGLLQRKGSMKSGSAALFTENTSSLLCVVCAEQPVTPTSKRTVDDLILCQLSCFL